MTKENILIVNYGVGNLRSLERAIRKAAGCSPVIGSTKDQITRATHIVLPGVGSYDEAILNMKKAEIYDLLKRRIVEDGVPTLGVCLGMQLLCKSSTEGTLLGLGVFDATVDSWSATGAKVSSSHIGWNTVHHKVSMGVTSFIPTATKFYFLHRFKINNITQDKVISTSKFGVDFPAIIQNENVWGVQFHPEKSYEPGKQILLNFFKATSNV